MFCQQAWVKHPERREQVVRGPLEFTAFSAIQLLQNCAGCLPWSVDKPGSTMIVSPDREGAAASRMVVTAKELRRVHTV